VAQPLVGWLVDRRGERFVLVGSSMLMFVVTSGYAGAEWVFSDRAVALWVLCACFVADQLLFSTEMARETYLAKIVGRPEDLAPSVSMGVTLNHISSMSLPVLVGAVWLWLDSRQEGIWERIHGYQVVFMGAALLAVLMAALSSLVRVPRTAP